MNENKKALDWLIQNPNHELAGDVVKKLGVSSEDVKAWAWASSNPDHELTTKVQSKVFDNLAKKSNSTTVSDRARALESGFHQGVTFGLSDEMAGVGAGSLDYAIQSVANLFKNDKDKRSWLEHYRDWRDKSRTEQKELFEKAPAETIAGTLGGGILMPGGAAKTIIGKGAVGVGQGALAGLGFGESDLTKGDVSGALTDVGTGAALGGTMGAGLPMAISTAKALPGQIKDTATRFAAKSAGFERGTMKKLGRSVDEIRTNYKNIGQTLLDEKIVTPGATIEKVNNRVVQMQKRAGEALGEIYEEVGKKASNPKTREVIAKVYENLNDSFGVESFADEAAIKGYTKLLDNLQNAGIKGENLSWKDLHSIRSRLGKAMKTTNPDLRNMLKKGYAVLSDFITEGVEQASQGDPKLLQAFKKNNNLYKIAQQVKEPLYNKLSAQEGNRLVSLTDIIVGSGAGIGVGLTSGPLGIFTVPATIIGKRLAEKYGNPMSASALNKIAKTIDATHLEAALDGLTSVNLPLGLTSSILKDDPTAGRGLLLPKQKQDFSLLPDRR